MNSSVNGSLAVPLITSDLVSSHVLTASSTGSSLLTAEPTATANLTTSGLSAVSSVATATNSPTSSDTTTAPDPQPTKTIDLTLLEEIWVLQSRRLSSIVGAIGSPNSIPAWLSSLDSRGKWPDNEVDYTTGCEARRANWPAQEHWQRILRMAGAWHGGVLGGDQFVKDPNLRAAISRAMDYWFGRDFANNPSCLDSGGTTACPCDNPDNSLWNTNWYSNVSILYLAAQAKSSTPEQIILIPSLLGQACLLLNETLAQGQLSNCTRMTLRSYGAFDRFVNGLGTLTGANTLDVARIGIDQALLSYNVSLLTDAYRRVHLEVQIKNGIKVDGVRADGSFGQHAGILYNGNYGKDYTNEVLDLEGEAGGTRFAARAESRNALATLFDGHRWMIYHNILTGLLHWDFSALGRFISFPVIDAQASGSIKINLTQVLVLGEQWSSGTLIDFANDLSIDTTSANAGQLEGNRMFYTNDYMVHRGRNYVSTLKMYSTRTQSTECVNSQNPKGFHLSDGVLHTYLRGNEYEDIAAAWDWNLIPGITVDYNSTPLVCATTQQTGLESFVGGVSDGEIGIGAMRYTTPLTKTLHWQKAWFFLEDDVQHVMVSALASTTNASVFSVLDQRRYAGSLIVNGVAKHDPTMRKASIQTLWHGDVGYLFDQSLSISFEVGEKTGAWSAIGTSTQPPATVDLFAAWIEHDSALSPIAYTVFPGATHSAFVQKASRPSIQNIRNDTNVSAIYDQVHRTIMVVFWNTQGGSATVIPDITSAPIRVTSNGNVGVIYRVASGQVTVADPSQSLISVQLSLDLGVGRKPPHWGAGRSKTLVFQFPSGGLAGSSVTQRID
ncbi:unnamed protein product [Cyclocybe aegerita]|uniref:Polysaccharide lyase family 8 protein n=1 Tax=Cyclocybe aegerita TaxID=1973307 RepID=A0A8S0XVG4_CYCAE|nr:unnamed protein product [Cyclocybe aegerita]